MMNRVKGIMRSTLVRYMISYTAIVLALAFGVGVYTSNSYAGTIRANIIENNINKLGKIRTQNEQYMTAMLSIANQISLSPYIKPFKFTQEPERAYHLKKQLIPYALTNGFINQLFLTFDCDDYCYSPASSIPLPLFLDELMRFERTTPEELLSLIRQGGPMTILPCQTVQSTLLDGTTAQMITVAVSLGMGERQRTGCVLFMIKEGVYHQLFADAIYGPRDTLIFHGDQVLVSGKSIGLPDADVLMAVKENQDTLVKDLFIGGQGYLLVAQRAQKYDMRYVTLIPLSSVRQITLQGQLGFMAFLLALSVPCMLLVLALSRRHARDIRKLRGIFGPSTTPFEDDLQAIHSGIEALVDRNELLHTRLDQSLPALRSAFILHLVKGRFRSRQEAVSLASELKLSIDKPYYIVALVDISEAQGSGLDIEHMIIPQGQLEGFGAELVVREQFLFVLFADTPQLLTQWISRLDGAGRVVVSSKVYEDFLRMGGAYLEASAAYDNRIVQDGMGAARFQGMQGLSSATDEKTAGPNTTPAHPMIREILAYMGEHFSDPNLSMGAIADTYSISAVRLSLSFKEAVGMSPSEYLLRLRMDKAQQLLKETGLSIKDICLAVGYYDVSGFIRRFKRYAGVTPMQFRQNDAGSSGHSLDM